LPEFQENGERSIEIFKFQMDKALQGEQAIFEIDQIDRHGKIIPTEVYLNKFPSKNSTKLRATILDNTERKNYQNELKSYIQFQQELIHRIKEQEASVSALINSSSDLIFSVDSNLYLTEFNDAFKNLVESSRNIKLTKGVSFLQYTFPELRESCSKSFKKSLQGESVNEIIECPKVSGDKCIMSVIYSPIFSADKKTIGVTVISRDITESKKAEEQLRLINKQVSEFKLKALRSAMNPHFLFNSLNSIQYFVAKNERKLALDYLSRFAVLIRKILDSSVNETVSLSTELEILKHYVSLEKLRFENKFDFEISVDPKIDEDQLFIPSLLIQPYVENAILHGLINKESVGFLQINISEKDKYLLVSVKDNGVGRKQASSARTPVKNKSYGMLLTQERLEMVNKTTDVSVNIIDLND
jgi:PAS domain S-box-containing protein